MIRMQRCQVSHMQVLGMSSVHQKMNFRTSNSMQMKDKLMIPTITHREFSTGNNDSKNQQTDTKQASQTSEPDEEEK